MKLLLHTCCAPCSVYCIDSLRKENIEPTVYWYNPNIHPYQEYKARRDCLKEYTERVLTVSNDIVVHDLIKKEGNNIQIVEEESEVVGE